VTILWDAYRSALGSIAQAVGRTPLVTLNRVTTGITPPIHLKLEWYGATGSLKDRIYLHMFDRAEARGDLRPGMRVLECSTGNAGIACAFVAAVKGYRCTIVMPEGMSDERKKLMRAYGASLVFTPGGESDVDVFLQRGRAQLKDDPKKAYKMFKVASDLDPSDGRAAEAIREAEREIRTALEKDGISGDRIPELAIPIQQLTDMTLSPHEGFVLSRVNGTWDVKSIMKISPMKELEVLMIFDKFVKDGVIKLKAKKKK